MDQAVMAANRQLKQALGAAVDDGALARALDLGRGNAVTLHLDGKASVQQGDYAYATEQGLCSCPDFEERQAPCQHVLAAEIHRRAQAILQAGQPAQAAPARPAAAAAWDVHKAQTSCSLKIQLGRGEIIYTMRATTDEEVMSGIGLTFDERLRARLAFIQELDDEYQNRQASRAELPAQMEPPDQSEPTADSGALEQMVEDAMQKAMQAWAAAQANGNGQAAADGPPAEAAASADDRDNDRGDKWCKAHKVWMKQRSNDGGSWHSHWIAADKSWCRGA